MRRRVLVALTGEGLAAGGAPFNFERELPQPPQVPPSPSSPSLVPLLSPSSHPSCAPSCPSACQTAPVKVNINQTPVKAVEGSRRKLPHHQLSPSPPFEVPNIFLEECKLPGLVVVVPIPCVEAITSLPFCCYDRTSGSSGARSRGASVEAPANHRQLNPPLVHSHLKAELCGSVREGRCVVGG